MEINMEYIPYVYIVWSRTTKQYYIGVRYAKGCHPSDLWQKYFTSSSLIHRLIEQFGLNDFKIRIIHQYPGDPAAAIKKEASYFPLLKKRDDYLNITYSSGIQDLRIASKAGKIGGAIVKARGIGIFAADADTRKRRSSKAGKIGGTNQFKNKIGIHSLTREQRIINSSKAGKANSLKNNWGESSKQALRGKVGGAKNKGFVWLTNGEIELKYTQSQQNAVPVDVFLKENPSFRRGHNHGRKLNENKNNTKTSTA